MKNFNLCRQQSIGAVYFAAMIAFGTSSIASAAPTATVPATVEAELMTTKTAGGAGNPGIYNLWSNGYVENSYNFPSSGAYDVKVAGYSTLAGGIGAQAEIRVNGVAQAGRQIFSETSLASRTFRINVTAGVRRIAVAFLNDTNIGGDRNLLLDKVSIVAVAAPVPAAPSGTTPNVPASIEAESMSVKSTGGADLANGVNLWNIWSNGYIENSFNFSSAGTYDITVAGFSTLADGIGAQTEVRVDGVAQSNQIFTETTLASRVFRVSVSAGVHRIAVAFLNDAISNGDRNLLVDKISVAAASASVPDRAPADLSGQGYPFGSRKIPYVAGIRPTVATQATQDVAVQNLYNSWKQTIVVGCGGSYVKFNNSYAAVSEGISYGMLITAFMSGYDPNARSLFDGLFKFARAHPAYMVNPNLMEWRVNNDCSSSGSGYNAIDGDLDIAMALLMADRQWGSTGAINYKAEAIKTINAMKAHNMSPAGYTTGGPAPDISRTSDYMIAHFRSFKKATGDVYWDTVINKSFELMSFMQSNFAASTGLIPDFIVGLPGNPVPSPGNRIESATEGFYAWNACRIPLRLGADYVTSGDVRSRDVAGKLIDFLNNKTGGDSSLIAMGYRLDGTPLANSPGYASPSFAGPALAGALVDARFQPFLNSLWNLTASQPATGYYDYELQLLGMMVASGNWWNP